MLIPVILCGGAGVRLWPESRESRPKPFLKIGEDDKSLLIQAYERALRVGSPGVRPLMVTNADYYFLAADELRRAAAGPMPDFLLEGAARNTAGAVLLAAMEVVARHGEDALMLVLPADHVIRNHDGFDAAIGSAGRMAETGRLVTFGIQPSRPETGYGYLKLGGTVDARDCFEVERFVEKPDFAKASAFLAEGGYLWNAGMFCFRAAELLGLAGNFCPEILEAAKSAKTEGVEFTDGPYRGTRITAESMNRIPSVSLDYAVMEKASSVVAVACDIGWSDVGAWDSVAEVSRHDDCGNAVSGEAVLLDTQDCLIRSESKTVATLGVSNLVVVDTPDALLVADRSRAADLRNLVNKVKTVRPEICREHRLVPRPWGNYQIITEGPCYKVRRVEVKVGGRLSLQKHSRRSEHWVILSGTARVTNGEVVREFYPNQSTDIPVGVIHRLENCGMSPLVMIEVQAGDYLGEDDIFRFEDTYEG